MFGPRKVFKARYVTLQNSQCLQRYLVQANHWFGEGGRVLFGDPADFAIEAEVDPGLLPPSAIWGSMCVWCRGRALGDLSERGCALYHAYCGFRVFPDLLADRWEPGFANLSGAELYELLEGASWAEVADAGLEVPPDWRDRLRRGPDPWRYRFLANWGEQFDRDAGFLVCPPGGAVLVLAERFADTNGCVEVSRAGMLEAAELYVRWFRDQSHRLGVPSS